nr:hypothetical protein BaRGS_005468 [Batillaria attramentaria]
MISLACSWSNEGCEEDEECCSKQCYKAHEGTNARCRHSSLGDDCVFDYHCQDDLKCGKYYNCCSPYWKMCMTDADCFYNQIDSMKVPDKKHGQNQYR